MADEVQVGFGRSGTHFWGFQSYGDGKAKMTVANLQVDSRPSSEINPDFVTLGKSMGNGFPVAALVTRKEITHKFDVDGIEYFNTYGGNPVSCRAAIAVLEVIEQEGLQEHAHRVGLYFLNKLKVLAKKYELIGDVRGRGLFLGIEIVRNRAKREPGVEEAKIIRAK